MKHGTKHGRQMQICDASLCWQKVCFTAIFLNALHNARPVHTLSRNALPNNGNVPYCHSTQMPRVEDTSVSNMVQRSLL
jgi:hypothetical protein